MPDLPADQRALLAAVIAAPDDDTPRLVYADWLEDAGDPVQAGYVRDSIRLARLPADDPERRPLVGRLSATLVEHSGRWAAGLGLPAGVTRYYRRGFVHTLEFRSLADYSAFGADWFRTAPVLGLVMDFERDPARGRDAPWGLRNHDRFRWFVESTDFARLRTLGVIGHEMYHTDWLSLLQNPALAGLRKLDVSWCRWTDEELETLGAQPHLTGLRVLDLGDVLVDFVYDGLRAIARGDYLPWLRALYFGNSAEPTDLYAGDLSVELRGRLTERFGDRWGNRRPPPPVWC